MIGIYKITSPSGKIYIGQSINIENRIRDYKNRKGPKQPKLNRSFLKYGFDAHVIEIIEKCLIEELNDKERYYQDLFNCVEKGLNCTLTSSKDKSGKLSIEHKKKISLGVSNPPQERRDKISKALTGKKRPESVKNKISESHKGIKHTEETKIKIAENSRNISDETRRKYSDSHKGHVVLPETRIKISKGLKGRSVRVETRNKISESKGIKVLNTETGEVHNSIAKAAKSINHNIAWLGKKLKGDANNNTNLKYA